jgi:hypothetical protein
MIATLVAFAPTSLPRLAVLLAWGSVAGSALQCAVRCRSRVSRGRAADARSGVGSFERSRRFVRRWWRRASERLQVAAGGLLPTGAVTGSQRSGTVHVASACS